MINRDLFTVENKKMNVLEFVDYVNKHKEDFKCYCEIIIDKLGFIYLATPNHQTSIVAIAAKQNNQSFNDYYATIPTNCSPIHWCISKDKMIAVWYNHLICPPNLNKFQKRVIKLLQHNGIILKKDILTTYTWEYQSYLKYNNLRYKPTIQNKKDLREEEKV